ncbi:ribokinase [Lacihabitans sp. LS3-19]|uniref:ribokinase n=1 Tax=Lacihabitans sp. LS3-19 TaxID=2487335 RepID=UPI0021D433C6|nr:ribokinase [Lacihabitans sp. LS3-19]
MNKIIVVGSSNTDMVIKSGKLPAPGETILGGEFFMNAGGKGANQAVAAARLGGKTVFVCKVGTDIFGDQALQQFDKEGIDTSFVFTDPILPSGVALINVDAKGENSITVASGANSTLSENELDKASLIFEAEDLLLIQLETPLETVIHTIKNAAAKGLKIVLNPAPATNLPEEIFQYLFAITPNETEAEILTGISVTDENSAQKAAEILMQKGVENVVITLGSKGAYLKNENFSGIISTEKVDALDTTAAGDCFSGAFCVGVLEGKTIENAVKFACQAASISVTRMGAQASIPYRNELNS